MKFRAQIENVCSRMLFFLAIKPVSTYIIASTSEKRTKWERNLKSEKKKWTLEMIKFNVSALRNMKLAECWHSNAHSVQRANLSITVHNVYIVCNATEFYVYLIYFHLHNVYVSTEASNSFFVSPPLKFWKKWNCSKKWRKQKKKRAVFLIPFRWQALRSSNIN